MTQETIANIHAVQKVLIDALQNIDKLAPASNMLPDSAINQLHRCGQHARAALAFVQLSQDETPADEDDTAILDVE